MHFRFFDHGYLLGLPPQDPKNTNRTQVWECMFFQSHSSGRASVSEHSRPTVSATGTPRGDHIVLDVSREVMQPEVAQPKIAQPQPEISHRDISQLDVAQRHPEAAQCNTAPPEVAQHPPRSGAAQPSSAQCCAVQHGAAGHIECMLRLGQ